MDKKNAIEESVFSLVDFVNENHIYDLIVENNLKEMGYTFHYFIDVVDIQRSCFPFGITREENRVNYYSQERENEIVFDLNKIVIEEQCAYSYFFSAIGQKVMIFDEYIKEWIGLHNFLEENKQNVQFEKERQRLILEKLTKITENSIDADKLGDEANISDFELSAFLSIALGLTKNGYDKLLNLEKTNLIFNNRELIRHFSTELEHDYVADWIVNTRPKRELTEEIFKLANSKSQYYDSDSRANVYRDCKAIDRILQLNNGGNNSKKKVLFIMLSSTKRFETIARKLKKDDWFPKIEGMVFNPFRNIAQIYCKMLLKGDYEGYYELLVRDKYKKIFSNDEKNINHPILKSLKEKYYHNFNNYIKELENYKLLSDHILLYPIIKNAIRSGKVKEIKGLEEKFNVILTYENVINNINEIRYSVVEKIKYDNNFNLSLLKGLYDIECTRTEFRIISGADFVVGHFHLIPLLFYFEDHEYKNISSAIADFSLIKKHTRHDSLRLMKDVISWVEHIFEKAEPSLKEKIVQCIILLLLPDFRDTGNFFFKDRNELNIDEIANKKDRNNDELVLDEIEFLLGNLDNISKDRSLHLNYLHLGSCVSRRVGNYTLAIEYAKSGLSIDESDSRFYHDLCLANYCRYCESITGFGKEINIDALEESLICGNLSLDCLDQKDAKGRLRIAINMAIKNTMSFLYCLKVAYLEDEDDIKDCLHKSRAFIKDIKSTIGKDKYDEYHEFLHTEANLELLEYKYFSKREKLNDALIAIDKAILLLGVCDYVKNDKRNWVISTYEKLKKEIERTAKKSFDSK